MTFERTLVLSAAFLALLLAHVIAVVRQRAYWPILPYSMFSAIVGDQVPSIVPFAVTAGGEELPFLREDHIFPFMQTELKYSLAPIARDRHSAWVVEALSDLIRRYEARRLCGLHDGPPIVGMRLYTVRAGRADWRQPWAVVSRQLIVEHHEG